MRKESLLTRRSVLYKWFISYTLILLIPVAISTFLLGYSIHLLEAEVLRTNDILLNQVKKEYDQILKSL